MTIAIDVFSCYIKVKKQMIKSKFELVHAKASLVESTSGTGKSILGLRDDALDLDSGDYKSYWDNDFLLPIKRRRKIKPEDWVLNPDWWGNYKREIVQQAPNFSVIAVGISDVVLAEQEEFKRWLSEKGLNYIVAIPEFDSLEELMKELDERRRLRGSPKEYRQWIREHQPHWIKCLQELDFPKIIIKKGEFLEQALVREGLI